ncbi:SIR2 family NAD-dependent protein deacylase [Thalassospira indica]|uniref:SIR2 family protein n=1 Tax=Thalassospira indica TaxID=1891279 RepID=A0ABM6XVZ6_9PROT|nr:SIR2 family protein [Thalassospira indica]AXO13686.1 SIR2 family protein [Thalassospira indica]OAZ14431.1 hypothetical protein TH15_01025 [Thalassospira profundimaris]
MANELPDIPASLLAAIEARRAVLFLGAGAAMECSSPENPKHNPPSANALRDAICDHFFNGESKDYDLQSAADFAIQAAGNGVFSAFIVEQFKQFVPSEAYKLITEFHWRLIATTNYDTLLEQAYQNNKKNCSQNLVRIVKNSEPINEMVRNTEKPVEYLKLHGCLDNAFDNSVPLILSGDSYDEIKKNRTRLFDRLEDKSFDSIFLFCGYSLKDTHIKKLVSKVSPNSESRGTFYIISPNPNKVEIDYWSERKVKLIDSTFINFMKSIDEKIPKIKRKIYFSEKEKRHPIYNFILNENELSDSTINYLDNDVCFVSTGMMHKQQDPQLFYQGFDTGFGCILQNLAIERKIVEDCLLNILEVDENNNRPRLLAFKGPAGNGKTITLKQTAWGLATSLNKPVIYLNEAGHLRWEAIEEISEVINDRLYICVDKTSQHKSNIQSVLAKSIDHGRPITIVTSETDSEWFTHCRDLDVFHPEDFRVRYLSRKEILALLEKLKQHKCEGVLVDLTEEEKIKRFEDKAERQLLVALHEATQGKRFEEIILNEYNRIQPKEARDLYLSICTMSQFGIGARAGTVRRLSGIDFKEYEAKFFLPLENIVKSTQDNYTRDVIYTARHSKVASLVFRGACETDTEKSQNLVRLLDALDIGYTADKLAFDLLTKGHNLIKNMSSPVAVRNIYKKATEIAPEAFVFQQWAIFESTHIAGDTVLARTAIEHARKLAPNNPTIIHTQAEVARKSANEANSAIEKKQLRNTCREHLNELKSSNNEYKASSSIKLLIDELSDTLTSDVPEEEINDKIVAVEVALANAQQQFPDEATFFECESRLHQIIPDVRKSNFALEKAIRKGTRSDTVWVRLANGYAKANEPEKEIETLSRALEIYPESKLIHSSIAKFTLRHAPTDLNKIEQHQSLAYDTIDRNYEARFIHAEILFALARHEESEKLFLAANKLSPSTYRKFPQISPDAVEKIIPRLSGAVLSRTESYLFVSHNDIPTGIYANEANSAPRTWDKIREGMQVSYEVRFSRRGANAVRIEI